MRQSTEGSVQQIRRSYTPSSKLDMCATLKVDGISTRDVRVVLLTRRNKNPIVNYPTWRNLLMALSAVQPPGSFVCCSSAELKGLAELPEVRDLKYAQPHKACAAKEITVRSTNENAITTSFFDLFKIGPGPSSSHTVGPMKAANDFLQDLRNIVESTGEADFYKLEIHLYGSLCLTGKGHGTDLAVIGGLLGWTPAGCDPDELVALTDNPEATYALPICSAEIVRLCDASKGNCNGAKFFPLGQLRVGLQNIQWHTPKSTDNFPHPNTLIFRVCHERDSAIFLEAEYYSVGGGFIEKKGSNLEGPTSSCCLPYPYSTMEEVKQLLQKHEGLAWIEILLANESAITGKTKEEIYASLDRILAYMEASVVNGLRAGGVLPGPIKLHRKAAFCYNKAKQEAQRADSFLTFLNAYAMAASEENADRRIVVTAPTSGSSGVIPGIIYYMKHHLYYPQQIIREALMISGCIGFLIKDGASISGAEMGCMGEIGVASAMGAAMLTHAAGADPLSCEAAAEIALEHHLGVTCDPIGGYVQVPCIQRNSMGAVKAYNAYLLAVSMNPCFQKISLDCCISTMRETGKDMSSKYKETSQGGLAVNYTEC